MPHGRIGTANSSLLSSWTVLHAQIIFYDGKHNLVYLVVVQLTSFPPPCPPISWLKLITSSVSLLSILLYSVALHGLYFAGLFCVNFPLESPGHCALLTSLWKTYISQREWRGVLTMMAYFALAAHHLVLLLCAIKIAIVGKNSSFSLTWVQLKPLL